VNACERYLNAINELVDGTLGPIRRAELELHLESCGGCRALAADLREIARAARSLDPLEPPQRAWQEIAGRLQTEGRVAPGASTSGRHLSASWLALAATLVIAIGASLFMLLPGRQQPAVPVDRQAPQETAVVSNVPPDDPVQAYAAELAMMEKHLQNQSDAIKALDPGLAAELEKNNAVIKGAIAENRKVLETDPENASALASLYALMKQKMQFIQDTLALMNMMRQGDAAGAAQIVDSGKS
jgi:anti-sigma factor RsiW